MALRTLLASLVLAVLSIGAHGVPFDKGVQPHAFPHTNTTEASAIAAANCFPAVGFQMPQSVPSSLNNWWCDQTTEHAFLGFSYEISYCAYNSPWAGRGN